MTTVRPKYSGSAQADDNVAFWLSDVEVVRCLDHALEAARVRHFVTAGH